MKTKVFSPNANRKLLIFKYILLVDLSKEYFELKKVGDNDLSHTVVLIDKPHHWSASDYEQLTLEVSHKKHSYSSVRKPLERTDYARHLNSRAIFDRLLGHFSVVFKSMWPSQNQANGNENKKVKYSQRFQIIEDSKLIDIKNNQLRLGFKWEGIKFKDLDVLLLINIGVKLQDPRIHAQLNESFMRILNTFVTGNAGGYFQVLFLYDL